MVCGFGGRGTHFMDGWIGGGGLYWVSDEKVYFKGRKWGSCAEISIRGRDTGKRCGEIVWGE
jgi:hypothetical protein